MSTARDPVAVIQAFDAAWNAGDLEKAMAFFADDAVVTQLPPPPDGGVYRGKEQIRRWAEPQIPGFHVDSRDRQASGETVTWTAQVIFDLLRQMGFSQPVEARCEAVVCDGKIASWTVRNPAQAAGPGAGPS